MISVSNSEEGAMIVVIIKVSGSNLITYFMESMEMVATEYKSY